MDDHIIIPGCVTLDVLDDTACAAEKTRERPEQNDDIILCVLVKVSRRLWWFYLQTLFVYILGLI